jgi:phosphatidylinositol glycan class B
MEAIYSQAGMRDKQWKKFVLLWSMILALILGVTAFFSLGYNHPDEHFQTIEFAAYKTGAIDASVLPWEFSARIRPWLQPACYYVIMKIANAAGVQDPFTIVMILRYVSAFFAWFMLSSMMLCAYHIFDDPSQRKWAVYSMVLLSFLPYMFVRTSSESLSSSFSMIGFAVLLLGSTPVSPGSMTGRFMERNYPNPLLFITGILWGLAFEFRYQVAFLLAGFIFWIFFISIRNKKKALIQVLVIFGGIFAVVIPSTFLDWWGYGSFTISPLNYFYQNIILDKSGNYGTMPFYGYIQLMLGNRRYAVMMCIILIGSIAGIIRYPKHPFSWGLIVFLLIHSMIEHKELRFLMSILIPALFLMVSGFSPKTEKDTVFKKIWGFRHSIPAMALYLLNVFMLLSYATGFQSAAEVQFEHYIYHNTVPPFRAYALKTRSNQTPLEHWFYKPRGQEIDAKESFDDIVQDGKGKKEFFVIISPPETDMDSLYVPDGYAMNKEYAYKGRDIYSLTKELFGKKNEELWALYKFTAQEG